MKKDLLICIAFHYSRDRRKYIEDILKNISDNYKCSYDIIIDTNSRELDYDWYVLGGDYSFTMFPSEGRTNKITISENLSLEHPFHLTWCHRKHIADNIDNYENFMYIEDDMLVLYENYLNYLENFKLLWPKYVPSFVRIEEKENIEYISDIPEKQPLEIIEINGKQFTPLKFPINYHAFWIMPAKEVKETIKADFVRYTDGREFAAMYVGWELGKQTLIEIENGQISKKCYSYHLPNNYALGDGPNGKIKPENIFI